MQREQEGAAVSTIRRRLAALSSLFKHLVKHGAASRNPVVDVDRPAINRDEGSTAAFSKIQARKIPDAPPAGTLAGLRDRAILPVGLQVGFRRAEIAALDVGDLHENRGFDALRVIRKGGRREALAISPQAAQRIRAYLEHAGHGDQLDAPLFRPLRGNAKPLDAVGRTRRPTRRSTTKFLSDRCLLGAGTLQAWVRPEILPFRDEFFKQ